MCCIAAGVYAAAAGCALCRQPSLADKSCSTDVLTHDNVGALCSVLSDILMWLSVCKGVDGLVA